MLIFGCLVVVILCNHHQGDTVARTGRERVQSHQTRYEARVSEARNHVTCDSSDGVTASIILAIALCNPRVDHIDVLPPKQDMMRTHRPLLPGARGLFPTVAVRFRPSVAHVLYGDRGLCATGMSTLVMHVATLFPGFDWLKALCAIVAS